MASTALQFADLTRFDTSLPTRAARVSRAFVPRFFQLFGIVDLATPVEIPPRPAAVVIPEISRKEQIVAHIEVTSLAQPAEQTTKLRILKWIESYGGNGVTLKQMCNSFPDIAPKGIASRVTEMVREGQLTRLGKFKNHEDKLVNFYTLGEK